MFHPVRCAILASLLCGSIPLQSLATNAPEVVPSSGDSVRDFHVVVTCSTPGAILRYTLDGSEPSESSPIVLNGGTVAIGRNLVFKARAWDAGGVPSSVTSATFRVTGMIAGGYASVLALKSNGRVYAWGSQASGQLADGVSTSYRSTADDFKKDGAALTPSQAEPIPFANAVEVAAGEDFNLVLDEAGVLWAVGLNASGQLGQNTLTNLTYARPVKKSAANEPFDGVVSMAAGSEFALAVTSDGKVWGWGSRVNGRLANTLATEPAKLPVPVFKTGTTQLDNAVSVAAGEQFGLALTASREVWSWGLNSSGQLGNGTSGTNGLLAARVKKTATEDLSNVVQIDAGLDFAAALIEDPVTLARTVWCWGQKSDGRLGDGVGGSGPQQLPVQVVQAGNVALSGIRQIACGAYHALALTDDGKVWAWGDNGQGQLGDGSTTNRPYAVQVKTSANQVLDRVVWISAGGGKIGTAKTGFSIAIRDDGTIFTWGDNRRSQLANGTSAVSFATAAASGLVVTNQRPTVALDVNQTKLLVPADIGISAVASDPDGSVSRVDIYGDSTLLSSLTTMPFSFVWTATSEGPKTIQAVAIDNFGEASQPATAQINLARPILSIHATKAATFVGDPSPAALRVEVLNGTLSQSLAGNWSFSGTAQSGLDYATIAESFSIPAATGVFERAVQATENTAGSDEVTLEATLSSSTVYQVQNGAAEVKIERVATPRFSRLLDTSFVPSTVLVYCDTPGTTIRYTLDGRTPTVVDPVIASGGSLLLGSSVSLKARAWDQSGRMSAVAQIDVTATGFIAGGARHALVLPGTFGTARAWGQQQYGRLGNGLLPSADQTNLVDTQTGPQVNLTAAIHAAAGFDHSLWVGSDGRVLAAGHNGSGELGNNSTSTAGLAYGGLVLKSPAAGDWLTGITAVSAGGDFSLALDGLGKVWSWGSADNGRLGRDIPTTQRLYAAPVLISGSGNTELTGIVQISAGFDFALARDANGSLWAWGNNAAGQLGTGNLQQQTRAVPVVFSGEPAGQIVYASAGQSHSAAIMVGPQGDRTVWCWGQQQHGRLGNGQTSSAQVPSPVEVEKEYEPGKLTNIVQVSAGPSHTLALDNQKRVWSWGRNGAGQLGWNETGDKSRASLVKYADGTILTDVVMIAAGGTGTNGFSLALLANGRIVTWGYNADGALADGTTSNRNYAQVAAGSVDFSGRSPTVSLSVTGSPFTQPATATLNATASQSPSSGGPTLSRVDFYANGTLLGSDSTAPYSYSLAGLTVGTHTFIASAVNSIGVSTLSTPQTITVSLPALIAGVAVSSTSENSSIPARLRISRGANTSLQSEISVDYETSGSATPNVDYDALPGNAVIPAGQASVEIPVTARPDRLVEGNETVAITILPRDHYSVATATSNVSIQDEPPADAPTLLPTPNGNLASPVFRFASNLPGATVKYTTNGSDPLTNGISIAPGRLIRLKYGTTVRAIVTAPGKSYSDELDVSVSGVAQIQASPNHSLAVDHEGGLWAWGRGDYGRLGIGSTGNQWFPQRITGVPPMRAAAAGHYHSLAVDENGEVWSFGHADNGRLGLGNAVTATQWTPQKLTSIENVTGVAAGEHHSLALKSDGSVWAFGYNGWGQLGTGSYTESWVPVAVPSLSSGVTAIAVGRSHSLAIKSDGTLWAWGEGGNGQLGRASWVYSSVPVLATTVTDVVAAAAGRAHSVALKADGTVWTTGHNNLGQLGRSGGTMASSYGMVAGLHGVVAIAAGEDHALAVKADGTVWVWGSNSAGQLGDGTTTQRNAPVLLGTISNVVQASAGSHTLVVTQDGTVRAFGLNSSGQLGIGNAENQNAPVEVSNLIFAARVAAPTVSIQREPSGAMRIDLACETPEAEIRYTLDGSEPTSSSTPFAVGASLVVSDTGIVRARAFRTGFAPSLTASRWYGPDHVAVSGRSHSLVIEHGGRLWSWGFSEYGKLGLGPTGDQQSPKALTGVPPMRAAAVGHYHSLAVDENGEIWAFGHADNGRLGLGNTVTTTQWRPQKLTGIGNVIQVAAGEHHSLALKADGSIWAFGYNASGQLGTGGFTESWVPVAIPSLSGGVVSVACGSNFSFALKADGKVYGWGSNSGNLGLGSYTNPIVPELIGSINDVVMISAGAQHAIALKADGTVWTAGNNGNGQLGDNSTISRTTFGIVPGLTNIVSVTAGSSHCLAVKADGTIWAWGSNSGGRLGDGTTTQRTAPVLLGTLSNVVQATAGSHTLILTQPTAQPVYSYYATGSNNYGELGLGHRNDAKTPVLLRLRFDYDNDQLPDFDEFALGTNPADPDTNRNGYTDGDDRSFGLSPSDNDLDEDGISNELEISTGTKWWSADSDGDGVDDGDDAFPTDKFRSQPLPIVPGDSVAPDFVLTRPAGATLNNP